ncbi:MAG: bifunctional acetate--CoA ligase family protein/GNAT family N-acetyltransferase [Cycloclasticus sp.]
MSNDVISRFFSPKSVVVIGASKREGSLGQIILTNLIEGGFASEQLHAVNPKYDELQGIPCLAAINDLAETPELAIIVSPANTLPSMIQQLADKGTQNAIIISAGFFVEGNQQTCKLEQQVSQLAQQNNIRIIGPNGLGVLSPINKLNASFSHLMPKKGNIGMISQSGAMLTSIIDWACGREIGFSHLVSLGDMTDIGLAEMLDFMSADANTDAILIYMETIEHSRRFISAARAASRTKPVVVLKVGRSAEGRDAITSHTGALASSDEVYEAAFNRCGLLRVAGMRELFYAAAALTIIKPVKSDRLAILTNGGGMGALATDALILEGGSLATLSSETLAALADTLPPSWSPGNPIDILGDADAERYANTLKIIQQDKGVDGVLVLNCPMAVASSFDIAQAITKMVSGSKKCLLTSWIGRQTAEQSRQLFATHNIPSYTTPEAAVNSFMHLVRYKRNQAILMETPPTLSADLVFDSDKAWGIIAKVISEGREWLNELEAKAVLGAYGIPTASTHLAKSPEEAAAFAESIGFPVVVKIFSPDILHKSDVRGVALNLISSEAVQQAAYDIESAVRELRPDARIEGFSVQKMLDSKGSHELILGVLNDQTFGPVLLFGQGGTAVEIINDKALALPPLNLKLARDMVSRTAVYRLLQGYRDQEAADIDAILLTLMKISQMVVDLDHLAELDINPLLANKDGVIVLDARIKVSMKKSAGADRLAIHPYPQKHEELVRLKSGNTYKIRPIRPEDEPALIENFEQLTQEEIRFRFFHVVRTMDHRMAARFTQIDYDREMALVVTDTGNSPQWQLYSVVRLIRDSSGEQAEFSLIVNHKLAGQGLGTLLMRRIISYAKTQSLSGIYGDVLAENSAMIAICKKVGFTIHKKMNDPGVVKVRLVLS